MGYFLHSCITGFAVCSDERYQVIFVFTVSWTQMLSRDENIGFSVDESLISRNMPLVLLNNIFIYNALLISIKYYL